MEGVGLPVRTDSLGLEVGLALWRGAAPRWLCQAAQRPSRQETGCGASRGFTVGAADIWTQGWTLSVPLTIFWFLINKSFLVKM